MSYVFWHKDHMTGEQIEEIFNLIQKEPGLSRTIWHTHEPIDSKAWVELVADWWFVRVASADDRTVGTFWLNGYQGRTAQIHFAIFDEYRHEAVQIGKATMQWLDELGWLHSVYGLTPVTFRHVFPFIEAIGFDIVGRLPGACWIRRKQKHVDGIVSVYDFGRKA
jgi:hypothetical protein